MGDELSLSFITNYLSFITYHPYFKMAKKVAKLKVVQTKEVPKVAETPVTPEVKKTPQFDVAYYQMMDLKKTITKEQYIKIRSMMVQDQAKGEVSEGLLRQSDERGAKEYRIGSYAMQTGLKWLWDKFIAGRIGNQMVANIVFQMLVQGVDDAYKALTNWLRHKNADAADTLEDTISTVDAVLASDKLENFKDEMGIHLEEVKRLNEVDKAAGKKVKWYRWILNVIKSVLS